MSTNPARDFVTDPISGQRFPAYDIFTGFGRFEGESTPEVVQRAGAEVRSQPGFSPEQLGFLELALKRWGDMFGFGPKGIMATPQEATGTVWKGAFPSDKEVWERSGD
jgi:hypothetical protein